MCNLSWISHKNGGGGVFCPIFRNHYFSMDSYYRDITCSKRITKSFVIFPDNDIQAYTYNNLMTFRSSITSIVIVIVGILVCIVVRLPTCLAPAP